MSTLYLKFAVVLEDFSIEPYNAAEGKRHHGPLFHRWLPNGEQHAVPLKTSDARVALTVWFERTGFVDHGRIRFDYERAEVDPKLLEVQDILDAGPLRGLCVLHDVTDDELIALHENLAGDRQYMTLGRRVAHLLHPPLARFINILRANYGQYWVSELKEWNPKEQSLGTYFETVIQTKWNLDNGEAWKDFVPELPRTETHVPVDEPIDYRNYLTEQDWSEVLEAVRKEFAPELAASTLVRTHTLIEDGLFRQALVEGVVALEIAMNEFMGRRLRGNKQLNERLQGFWSLPLQVQFLSVAATLNITPQEIEPTLRAIELRNKVVHEGWEPPQTVKADLNILLKTVGMLLPGPRFRFPAYRVPDPAPIPEAEWEGETPA